MTNNDRINFRINENAKALVEALAAAIDETPAAVARYMIEKHLTDFGLTPGFFGEHTFDKRIQLKITALSTGKLEQLYLEVKKEKTEQTT